MKKTNQRKKMKIDWYYHRKGWVSCKKAQEVLEIKKVDVTEQGDAKKEKIDDDQAWEMLSKAPKVFIAQGKKLLEFIPSSDNKEEILKRAMGRSGNLRAPTLLIGESYYVGFSADMYEELF